MDHHGSGEAAPLGGSFGEGSMRVWAKATGLAVHLLTASGAVLGLLALNAATRHDWSGAFMWLGWALVVDGIDGPIARRVKVAEILPRFSGVNLDLIVDYVNYCLVPAFIVMEAGLMAPPFNGIAAAVILLTSLYHFCDQQSKTKDGFFVGFPAIWNVICFYVFVLGAPAWLVSIAIAVLGAATFLPVKWPHPLRARALRPLTLGITALWLAAAFAALLQGFPSSVPVKVVFIATAIYVVALGAFRTSFADEAGLEIKDE